MERGGVRQGTHAARLRQGALAARLARFLPPLGHPWDAGRDLLPRRDDTRRAGFAASAHGATRPIGRVSVALLLRARPTPPRALSNQRPPGPLRSTSSENLLHQPTSVAQARTTAATGPPHADGRHLRPETDAPAPTGHPSREEEAPPPACSALRSEPDPGWTKSNNEQVSH